MRPARRLALFVLCLLLCTSALGTTPGGWVYTGNLNTHHGRHTATLLTNGSVLITGGVDSSNAASIVAELYNSLTGAFALTGNLNDARYYHTATLLNNGMVLIAGGSSIYPYFTGPLSSAELYNPATGTFTRTGSLNIARALHTATLLSNGMVLVAGGKNSSGISLASAELYDPATGTFTVTGSLNTARDWHTATLLNNGNVLVAGGEDVISCGFGCNSVLIPTAELYNPAMGTFTFTGSLNATRTRQTATLLNSGMVLVAGGASPVYPIANAEVYSPSTGTFTVTGSLNTARDSHTAALLNNGNVLVAGGAFECGSWCGSFLSSAELYQPTSLTPPGLLSISISPANPWVPIGSSMSFTATGTFSGGGTQTLGSVTWSSSNTAVATITSDASNHGKAFGVAAGSTTISACAGSVCGSTTMTVAPHTNLLIGSTSGDSASSTFESYDDAGTRLRIGNLSVPRSSHSATLLQNGTIFVAGGVQAPGDWQILDINGNVLSSGTLQTAFNSHLAVLLGNRNVFLAGGTISPGTWEIHSPTGALVSSGSLLGQRSPGAGAVLLQNGNVWIFGSSAGLPGGVDSSSWEIRDSNGNLVSNGTLATSFSSRQVFTLSNGNIIFLGGVQTAGQYDIYTQTGALVRSGTLTNAFDGNAGGALVGNNVFLFERGYWEYLGFDANANPTFDTVGTLFDSRQSSGVVVTSTGKIFITGGDVSPATWEMYTPTGTTVILSSRGNLFNTRYGGHSLTHF